MAAKSTQRSISSLGIRRGVSAKRYLPETNFKTPSPSPITKKNIAKIDESTLRQTIEKKAYELFEKRGWANGYDLQDWLEAEQIVARELQRP